MSWFHLANNIFFEQHDGGRVQIVATTGKWPYEAEGVVIVASADVSAEQWASLVSAMSGRGEIADSWTEALEFHMRKPK